MRILLLNPNTSRAMTAKIADVARGVAGPGVEIEAVCPAPGHGPAAVETHIDEVRAVRCSSISAQPVVLQGLPSCDAGWSCRPASALGAVRVYKGETAGL